jgi:integrase
MSGLRRFLFPVLAFLFTMSATLHAAPLRERNALDYSLEVALDIAASKITGLARIPVTRGQELRLKKEGLKILHGSLSGEEMAVFDHDETLRILPLHEGTVEIKYEGAGLSSIISAKGIFLSGIWYPRPEQMAAYHLTATLPEGYAAISEAETIEKAVSDGATIFRFSFPHPLDSIVLIATNRYKVVKEDFCGVEIYAYFFQEDAELIPTYLEHTKKYLTLYDRLLFKFPYRRFSVVENFLPTGYSMPTFALLGQEVVRFPFIPETSLGHEILHQWFGNLVYIDYGKGNWAEGLTTFLADHLYEEEKGRGSEYRKEVLINYQSYVNDKKEFPLKDFRERTNHSSEAIGYGKALMVLSEYKALKDALPEELKPIVTFGYHSGWRKSEILGLTWDRVDLREGIARLDPGETKNEEGRTLYMNEELMKEMKALHGKRQLGCPHVFHRDGEPIKGFRKAWVSACIKVGLCEVLKDEEGNPVVTKGKKSGEKVVKIPTKILHDFRRTAIRDMVRSGVSERVAMKISGHRTRNVFDRYNIVSDQDLKDAAQKKQAYTRSRMQRN